MNKNYKAPFIYIISFSIIVILAWSFIQSIGDMNKSQYSITDLKNDAKNKLISKVEIGVITNVIGTGTLTITKTNNTKEYVDIPSIDAIDPEIQKLAEEYGFQYYTTSIPRRNIVIDIIFPTITFVCLIFAVFYIIMQVNGGSGGSRVMNFGKNRAKMVSDDKKKVTFGDVAGLDEEKLELSEIVDFLKQPKKYIEIGARIPKGVLLVGPPGTGKTLLAKAVSGEAGVPFFSISGSDFVEMFVGVGASRVRDLFDQAKKNLPCIVFIDEIDAVGRRRGAGLGGGHDEREQTLNQLLVEMDGFGVNEGVIIIAATNRPDILDPALLRAGRFDRQVVVGVPDVKGREEILKVHAKGKLISKDVSFKTVALTTSGFTGADLENLLNEAALLAARSAKKEIDMEEIRKAFIKIGIGTEKKNRAVNKKERNITAYHEAGHAIIHEILPELDPVHIISIIPTGRAGGYTLPIPDEDLSYWTRNKMRNEIVALLGGRVAEELVLDDITTGASNDIERTTDIARKMVKKFGMSERLGPVLYGKESEEVFLGARDSSSGRDYGEDVASLIDTEIRNIVSEGHDRAKAILTEHMDVLHKTAEILLEKEKITGDEFRKLFPEGVLTKEIKTEVNSFLNNKEVTEINETNIEE